MQRALAESHFSALYYYIIFYKKVNIEIAIVLANNGESAAIPEGVIEVTARMLGTEFVLRGCPACFLILKGVVISSHETNRFS